MKIPVLPVAFAVSFALAAMVGCTKSPTQPDPAATLKNSYVALTEGLEREVEAFRGKNFKRSIAVAVYTKEQYSAMLGNQVNTSTPAERQLQNGIFQCEGLMRKNSDFFAGYDSLMSDITGGFYVDGADSINIILQDNVTGPSLEDSVTIFHELIHAMQDQYFDLTTLQNNVTSGDQSYALRYVVEGEAELLCTYYEYKLYLGSYPSSSAPIMNAFDHWQLSTDTLLDSMHKAGEPMLVSQPTIWAYYSYGPKFIDSVAGTNWSVIDNVIFASLPTKTAEVMHPSTYINNRQEYELDAVMLANYIGRSNLLDQDELGEMLTCVMFREWDFASYRQIAQGLLADQIFAYHDAASDTLRMAWYTYWQDSVTAASFMSNYASLAETKLGISLPAPAVQGAQNILSDTVDKVYIEQNGASVFVLENYPQSMFSGLVSNMRGVTPYLRTLAKRTAEGSRHPFVDKTPLAKGAWHPPKRRHSF